MTIMPAETATVKAPTAAEAEKKVRELVERMIDRTRRMARFDVDGNETIEAFPLYEFAVGGKLMFDLHDFYEAVQTEIRKGRES